MTIKVFLLDKLCERMTNEILRSKPILPDLGADMGKAALKVKSIGQVVRVF